MATQPHLLVRRLDALFVGPGHTFGVGQRLLTIFPLTGPSEGPPRYSTFAEALATETIDVGELSPPEVNRIQVVNRSALPVLITDGEALVGGGQNRVVNSSVLVPPDRTILPISCVEHGRWNPGSAGFTAAEAAYPSLRAAKAQQVHNTLQATGEHQADQGQVWASIAAQQAAHGVASATGAMHDLYASRSDALVSYARAFPYPPDVVGLIAAYGGRIVSLEAFDSSETMRALWHTVIRAAALETLVLPPGPAVPHDRAVRMLHRARKATIEQFSSPGIGMDTRCSGNGVVGSALILDATVIHATLHRVPGH
ncbi:MAG: DUF6569 family protein [Thermomicrobiales bacterium]